MSKRRCMQLQAKDARPRRGMKVTVREHLDGGIELYASDDRPLAYQTLDEQHLKPKPPVPPACLTRDRDIYVP